MSSFFVSQGDGFVATEWTRGPWSNEHQHGGPPSALMARAIERALEPGLAVVRLTVEFFRPVPIGPMRVAAEVAKAGRKVTWLSARLTAGGQEVCRATSVAIRRAALDLPDPGLALTVPGPEDATPFTFPFFKTPDGYHTAMEVRIARGEWGSGATAAWMRMRYPLLPGETPSPLQRVVCAADSGGGIAKVLDTDEFTFMNPDLSIHLQREAAGEWVCLDARTIPRPSGIGLVETELSDASGPIGRGMQNLLIEQRAG